MGKFRIKLIPLLSSLAFLLILFELGFLIAFRAGLITKGVFFGAPAVSQTEFATYLDERDPALGWPTRSGLAQNFSGNGYRISPVIEKLPEQAEPCLAVYGDSLAYGSEIEAGETWPDALAGQLGCKVLNYGVPGYAADQAQLRFEAIHPAGVPALMTFTEINLSRNLAQAYELWSGRFNLWTTKPRFRPGPEQLELITLPVNDYAQLKLLNDSAKIGEVLSEDFFLPDRTLWGATTAEFPYLVSAFRLYRNKIQRKLYADLRLGRNIAPWGFMLRPPLFRPAADPMTAEASIQLQLKLLERFTAQCRQQNLRCYILMLPVFSDFATANSSGNRLATRIGQHPPIAERVISLEQSCLEDQITRAGKSAERIADFARPGGHYNAEFNQFVAACLLPGLRSREGSRANSDSEAQAVQTAR